MQLLETVCRADDVDSGIKSLVKDVHHCYSQGLFDDRYMTTFHVLFVLWRLTKVPSD